jgi:hypothetical protein
MNYIIDYVCEERNLRVLSVSSGSRNETCFMGWQSLAEKKAMESCADITGTAVLIGI